MQVPLNYGDRHVCIIGLGYVGLTLAVAMAEIGYRVHGVERSDKIVSLVRDGRAHFSEKGLDERLGAQIKAGRLTVSRSWPSAGDARVFIITVGTPLRKGERAAELDSIKAVAQNVAAVLNAGDMVILRSTVRVGVSREIVKPLLDESGQPYHLVFCPERTLEGRALEELRSLPQIVGGVDEASTVRAAQLFSFLTPTTIKVSSLEVAELIKLVNNTQRDLLFAFSNEVAQICDTVGVSASELIKAGNMGYTRSSLAMPGPVGGPCLEKDPYILAEGLRSSGHQPALSLAGRKINEELPAYAVGKIRSYFEDRDIDCSAMRIAILGLAFKGRPETSDLRGTMAVPLMAALRSEFPDAAVVGFDPAVDNQEARELGINVADTVSAAVDGARVVLFQTNHRLFEQLRLQDLSSMMASSGVIYDFWNQFTLDQHELQNAVTYVSLGGLCYGKVNEA